MTRFIFSYFWWLKLRLPLIQTSARAPCSDQMIWQQPAIDAVGTYFTVTSSSMQTHQSSTYHNVWVTAILLPLITNQLWYFKVLGGSWAKVPLRQKSINDIGARYYKTPGPFHDSLTLAVPSDWVQQNFDLSKVKPVSPMENILSFLLCHGSEFINSWTWQNLKLFT